MVSLYPFFLSFAAIPAVPGSVAAPAATSAPVVVDRGHPPTVPPSITDLIHNPKAASPATYNPPPKTVAPPPKPLLNSAVPKQIQQPRGQNH